MEHYYQFQDCINYLSHCCDKIPDKSNLRKNFFLLQFQGILCSMAGRNNGNSGKRLFKLCPEQTEKTVMNACAQLTFFLLIQSGTTAHEMVWSTFMLIVPMSVNLIRAICHTWAQRLSPWWFQISSNGRRWGKGNHDQNILHEISVK